MQALEMYHSTKIWINGHTIMVTRRALYWAEAVWGESPKFSPKHQISMSERVMSEILTGHFEAD